MRLRPCIDIHNGVVKQIIGGTITDDNKVTENFVSAEGAAYYADIYRREGLYGGHVILLNSRERQRELYEKDKEEAFRAFRAYPGGMMAGGGIDPYNAEEFLDAGASHVIVTSYVFTDGRLDREHLTEMYHAVGKERLVLDLSCRKRENGSYVVVTDRWQKFTDVTVTKDTLCLLSECCDEFLVHAADVEGKRGGIDISLVETLSSYVRETTDPRPVTYAGGVHSIHDIHLMKAVSGGSLDVTVGSALSLFGGNITLSELKDAVVRIG